MRHPIHSVTCGFAVCLALAAFDAHAAGARTGVQPRHGEMVLLRDVGARHAVRPAPPSIGLIVDPTPNRQLMPALASAELSDADFLALDTGPQTQTAPVQGGLAAPMVRTLAGPTLGGAGRDAVGQTVTGALGGGASGPLGAVGNATRGIGGHVTGALSQLPFGQPAGGRGP